MRSLSALLALVLSAACSRAPEPARSDPAASSPAKTAEADKKSGPLTWKAPARWEKATSKSGMRLESYRVPKADGDPEDGDLSVSAAGGSVEMNVDRWEKQIVRGDGDPEGATTKKTQGDLKITVVERWGTYNGGPMAGGTEPKKNWALLGAVVEVPKGKALWFFKLLGPPKTVAAARAEFDALIESLTFAGP